MDITKRFNRIVAIYFQLQAKAVVRAQDLADRFEVSLRTIYRDIRALEQAGIPIYGEPGTGYSLMEGYRLPATRFSQEEILSMAAAEKLMQKFVDPDLFKHFGSAINKIRSYLRYSEKVDITLLEENMLMGSIENTFNEKVPSALSILFEGIAQHKIVQMAYQNSSSSEFSRREIEPVGVFHQGNFWYFMAYCHLREDYRQFRIDRIQEIKLSSQAFTQEHKPLSHYLNKKEDIPTTAVRISVPRAFARYMQWDRPYYGFVSEEINGDNVIMTFKSRNVENEFARWYLMFADQSTILEPEALKEYVRKLIASIRIV